MLTPGHTPRVGPLAVLARARKRLADRPADWMRLLPLQLETLSDPSKVRLIRAGNQTIGKSICGVLDLIGTATGLHPWCPDMIRKDRGLTCIIIFSDKTQALGILSKLFALIPKDLLHPETVFVEGRGLRARSQTFKIKHVPSGQWSTIYIKANEQGPRAFEGMTADYVWIDEAPDEDVFDTALRRLQQAGRYGRLLLTMTPQHKPCDWLKQRVDEGKISDHWRPLTPDELVPVGAPNREPLTTDDGEPKDQAFIDRITAEVPDYLVPVKIHGEWEVRTTDRIFSAFRDSGDESHVRPSPLSGTIWHLLGLDFGTRAGKQTGVLVEVLPGGADDGTDAIHILDEDIDLDGQSTTRMDADRTLDMLGRHGLTWAQGSLDFAAGDRDHISRLERKSANEMMDVLARILGVGHRAKLRPQIMVAKKDVPKHSREPGIGFLHRAMVQPKGKPFDPKRFSIDPRCVHTIEAFNRWKGDDDGSKDKIDALRYALVPFIFPREKWNIQQIRIR